jgi:hypothetical protein
MKHGTYDVGALAVFAVALAFRLTPSQRYVLTVAVGGKQRWHLRPTSKRTITALREMRLLEPEPPAESLPDGSGLRPTYLGRIVASALFRYRVDDTQTTALSLSAQPAGGLNLLDPVGDP